MLPTVAAVVVFASLRSASADECVLDLAVACLDATALAYVDWLEARDRLNVVGDFVTVVKKRADDPPGPAAQAAHDRRHRVGGTSLGPAVDRYFDTHALRISLPWIPDGDIDLELDRQGRGKKPKLKQLKKLMSLLGVIMCAKLSLMGPLAMVMIGAKAIKALMLAVVSLTISKMMLLKKLKAGGGGGGGGGSIVQADWPSDKDDRDAHLLAYNGQQSSSPQQPQQNVIYPLYEPHGYHGAA